jgi:tetratricopeptide (TPR) repeat protein
MIASSLALSAALTAFAPADAMDPEARERFTRGLEQYQSKEYASAVKEFRVAYALDPRAEILFAWAQAERLYGRCSRATKLYRRFLTSKPSDQQAGAARQGVDRCRDQADTAPTDPDDREPELATPEPEPAPEPPPEPVVADTPDPPPPPRRRVDPAGVALLTTGVVLGGVGGGLLGAGAGKARGLDDATNYDAYGDRAADVRTLRIAGGVLAGVGGALILAGIIKLVVHRRASRRDLSVWTNPEGAGVVMRLRF